MKKHTLIILSCLFVAVLGACRPTVNLTPIDPSDGQDGGLTYITTSDSYADIFKAFWQGMNTNYAFWDVEPTSYWDEVWNTYKPKFDALGTYSDLDTAQVDIAKDYLKAMVKPLKDGHFTLKFEDRSPSYSPGFERVSARYALPVDQNTNPEGYFDGSVNQNQSLLEAAFPGTLRWAHVTGDKAILMATGTSTISGGHIRYLYFDGFSISNKFNQTDTESVKVKEIFEEYIADLKTEECKGVIIDVRGNGGGNTDDIPLILSPLLASDLHYENTRLKRSVGRLDYTAWTPDILKANPVGSPYRALKAGALPVVAIINDYSVSCAEALPIAVKAMPGGYLIGTQTWGATGSRIGDSSPSELHGGCFTHNKLWTQVVDGGKQARGLQYENYEGEGVTPNKVFPFDRSQFTDVTTPKDVQLDAAIYYLSHL
jgi:hypothetical protein